MPAKPEVKVKTAIIPTFVFNVSVKQNLLGLFDDVESDDDIRFQIRLRITGENRNIIFCL